MPDDANKILLKSLSLLIDKIGHKIDLGKEIFVSDELLSSVPVDGQISIERHSIRPGYCVRYYPNSTVIGEEFQPKPVTVTDIVIVPKRGRGRPRKVVDPNAIAPPKRPRGRPCKNPAEKTISLLNRLKEATGEVFPPNYFVKYSPVQVQELLQRGVIDKELADALLHGILVPNNPQ